MANTILKIVHVGGPNNLHFLFLPISLGEDLKKRSSQRKKKSSGLACNWSSLINHQRLVHWEQLIHQHYQKNKFVVFWVVKKNGCFSVGGSISIEQQASNQMIGKLHGGGMERRDGVGLYWTTLIRRCMSPPKAFGGDIYKWSWHPLIMVWALILSAV
jgi:hypothetical protein